MLAKLAYAHARALDILLGLLDTTTDPKELRRICIAILNLKHPCPERGDRGKGPSLATDSESTDDASLQCGKEITEPSQPHAHAARAVPPVTTISTPGSSPSPASPPHRVTASSPKLSPANEPWDEMMDGNRARLMNCHRDKRDQLATMTYAQIHEFVKHRTVFVTGYDNDP